jgi:Ca2+-binding EF-hand superfamily protein
LFVLACKSESKPAPAGEAKTEEATKVERPRVPRPSLPDSPATSDDNRPRPRLPDGAREPRDWSDPAAREEMRARMEERRKMREQALDTNKDGVISPEERQARLKPMIERFDQNSDGKLTPEELASSDRRMGFDDPAAIDSDKDGEISLKELDAAVTARRDQMRARWRGRGGGSADGVGPD